MSFFTDQNVEALVGAEVVEASAMFRIELLSGTIYATERSVPFIDNTGQSWNTIQGVISYDGLSYQTSALAAKRTYTLEAGDPKIAFGMIGQETEYRGRNLVQLIQFFTDGVPVGNPIVQHSGIMDRLSVSIAATGAARLSVDCESPFVIKNNSVLGLYTHGDQQARYPDDNGLERVKLLSLGESVKWPDF